MAFKRNPPIPLYCPVCHRQLGKSEALFTALDSVGSVVTWHLVPKDTPYGDGEDGAPIKPVGQPIALPTGDFRTRCGVAGFTEVVIR